MDDFVNISDLKERAKELNCGGKLDREDREFYSELFEITIQRYIIK